MGDGRSSVSPYDTAWVSFIEDSNTNINGTSKSPLFPSCLQWIIDNQLDDGSWGKELVFCIYDRLLNTLACVVALTLWNTCLHKRNKGVMFIKENLSKLEGGEVENMTSGFEFVFPALLEKAQQLHIDNIPYDAPAFKDIYARREVKFTRFPKELIHTIPTIVLFSLEGLRDLDWQRLLKLQMEDGSFLTSPSSTAIAFLETNDEKCLTFLQNVVQKFNGGDVLNKFKDGDEFFCLRGESNKSATVMFNLYRCSQALFLGEMILEEAKNFTYNFLHQYLANNQSKDKWVIAKDIPGEIQYALEFQWYASLPRVESRLYIDQYGGANEIWISKTLYRMPDVSNNVYLEAAKLDYNRCQSQHRLEWLIMQEWFEKCNFEQFGISKKEVLVSYFLAASSIFEVEKSRQRLAWAKSSILCKMITSYINKEATTWNSLLMEFKNYSDMSRKKSNETKEIIVLNNLCQFLHQLAKETYQDLGKDIHHQLHNVWEEWLEENNTTCQEAAVLLVQTINLSSGHMTHD
ncbi:hypothetical protein H5410_039714 [Solanum commersonii]|uniref:Terpene synthase N-terminal domain-containing protein n=1 Tax=Solanum commersonii TaxID=4109 RepID=A0A9J5XQ09_SOLCO|nr:hypothetical protein H5410_039714 [Solanum commersonii]